MCLCILRCGSDLIHFSSWPGYPDSVSPWDALCEHPSPVDGSGHENSSPCSGHKNPSPCSWTGSSSLSRRARAYGCVRSIPYLQGPLASVSRGCTSGVGEGALRLSISASRMAREKSRGPKMSVSTWQNARTLAQWKSLYHSDDRSMNFPHLRVHPHWQQVILSVYKVDLFESEPINYAEHYLTGVLTPDTCLVEIDRKCCFPVIENLDRDDKSPLHTASRVRPRLWQNICSILGHLRFDGSCNHPCLYRAWRTYLKRLWIFRWHPCR